MRGGYPKGKPLLQASLAAASSGCRGLLCIRRCQTTVEIDDQCAVTRARSPCSSISLQLLAGQLDEARRLSVLLDSTAEDMGEESCAQKSVRHNLLDDRKRTCSPHRQQRPAPAKIGRRFMLGEQMLDADFPVAGDVRHRRAAVGRQIRVDPSDRRRRTQAEEDNARHDRRRQAREVQVRRLRILGCDRRGRAQKAALKVVGPAVEAAAKALAASRRRPNDLHVLVPTGITEDAYNAFPVTNAKDAPAPYAGRQEVPWTPDLSLRAERQPIDRENRAFLGLEGFAAGVILGFHVFSIQYWNISIQF